MGRRSEQRHAALVARLAAVQHAQHELQQGAAAFAVDVAATEKRAASLAVRELVAQAPAVTALVAQTGAVVERVANANDVAEKMTREVRRLDIIQSRLTQCLTQSAQLLTLRNSLAGLRRAMAQRDYPAAAGFLDELHAIERAMALDAADKLRMDTIESDLKAVIESSFESGLRAGDRGQIQTFAPLFRVVGRDYEARGFSQLLSFVEASLESELSHLNRGTFSTKELMEHLTELFNRVAALEQEYSPLLRQCFARVDGANRLLASLYASGETYAVQVLGAYMRQRKFLERMNTVEAQVEQGVSSASPSSAAMATPSTLAAGGGSTSADRGSTSEADDDAVARMNEQLNEVALVIQHTQTYERFMRSRVETPMLPADAEDSPDISNPTKEEDAATSSEYAAATTEVLPPSHESELGKTVQELAGFYCYFENDLLNRAARKAFQWEELRYSSSSGAGDGDDAVVCFPISSAVDEIFYVARNSGLRALATGHSDCAAGVLNMINTVLRDVLGDAMRARIRSMATFVKFESETTLLAASTQLRDQMQQQFAKLSKTMGPLQIPGGAALNAPGSAPLSGSGAATETRKECGPDVVMNSLEATTEYIAQIKAQFEHELAEDFADVPPHLASCLNQLEDASSELRQLLNASRKKLLKLLEPKLASAMGALLAPGSSKRAVSYELTEQQFTFNEANDPFAQQFVAGVRALLGSFRSTLSPTNYRELVELAASATAALFERWFHSKSARFNQLGALQFDKDLRVIAAFFGESCDCRDAFAVLTQTAEVLTADAPSDVLDVFGRKRRGTEWKLSAARVKEILSQRVEFTDAAINKLVLAPSTSS